MIQARDRRRHGFAILYREALELLQGDAYSQAIYWQLVDHANKDREAWPSTRSLVELTGGSRNTVTDRISKLVALGLIERRRRAGKITVYYICDLSERFEVSTSEPAPSPASSDPTINAASCVLGDAEEGRAILISAGLAPSLAGRLASGKDPELVRTIVDYWARGAGGVKPVGTGLLIRLCQAPEAMGFYRRDDGGWHAPAVNRASSRSKPAEPKPRPDVEAQRRRAAEEAARSYRDWNEMIEREQAMYGRALTTVERCELKHTGKLPKDIQEKNRIGAGAKMTAACAAAEHKELFV